MKRYFHSKMLCSVALLLSLLWAPLSQITATAAQDDCSEINELMTFDYRNWGIGVHRDCEIYDLYCQTMKGKQIAFGLPVQLWILASREAALAAGVNPIPEHIRTQVAHLFPASMLDQVRYKSGSGFIGSLQSFRAEFEGKGAITLKDVIVFAKESDAQCNVRLWAHELEHIRQYGNLGVDGFAQAYVDQTCIFPGKAGYDTQECKLERWADRKMNYFNQPSRVLRCTGQKAPASIVLQSCPLNMDQEFVASDSIRVGPDVILGSDVTVALRAGRIITLLPGFKSDPRANLKARIEPDLR